MQVTYILGNGLDLQYGLKTKYIDFYNFQKPEYLDKVNKGYHNFIYDSLFHDEKNNYENWADFEFAIGKLSIENTNIENQRDKFLDDLSDVLDDLKLYLKNIQDSFEAKDKAINFSKTISNLIHDVPKSKKAIIEKVYRSSGNNYDTINLLSCNYTDILDELYFNSTNEFKSSFRNTNYGYSIKAPIHLHGTLNFGMTLGLSDDSQIAKFFSEDEKRYLLKEKLLEEMRESLDIRNSQIISNSDIIIIYGMSLGDTDKYLWNMIANQSIKYRVPVVVYHYITNFDMSNPIKVQRFYNSLDNKFIEQSGLDEAGKKELNKNLITVIGKSIFDMEDQ